MDIRCQGVWGMSDMVIRQWWADRYISDDARAEIIAEFVSIV